MKTFFPSCYSLLRFVIRKEHKAKTNAIAIVAEYHSKNNVTSQDLLLNPKQKHLSYLTSIKKQVFIQTDYAGQSFKNENRLELCIKPNFERPHYNPFPKCIYLGLRNHIFHYPACFQGSRSNKDRWHSLANFFRIAESLLKASTWKLERDWKIPSLQ